MLQRFSQVQYQSYQTDHFLLSSSLLRAIDLIGWYGHVMSTVYGVCSGFGTFRINVINGSAGGNILFYCDS